MKKSILWGALFTLICTQLHAEETQQTVQSQTPGTSNSSVTTTQTPAVNQNTPTQTNSVNQLNQPTQDTQQNQNTQTQTTQTTNQQPGQNVPPQTTEQVPVEQQQATQIINCNYKIPAETKIIDQSLVLTWSEKATTQAFDFEPASLEAQLHALQACFTDQGWQGFNSALQKSGNIEAIKTQNLTVSSQLDGQAQMTQATENEWKITLPLQVVYQNNKEKVTQLLTVNLTIGRKITGDLGITQMIASPRTAAVIDQSNDPATVNPANTSSTPNTVDTGSTNTGTTTPPTNTDSNTTNTNTMNPPSNTDVTVPTNSNTTPASINDGTNQQNPNSGTTTTSTPGSSN